MAGGSDLGYAPRMMWLVATRILSCGLPGSEEPAGTLALQGEPTVEVDRLGLVRGMPQVTFDDVPIEPVWVVDNPVVARVDEESIVALGEGRTVVRGTYEDQTVEWTLVVMPAVTLHFGPIPGRVRVGASQAVSVLAHLGDSKPIDPGPIAWRTSNPAIATVSDGVVEGVAPGLVFITASVASSEAMLELEVVQ